MMHTRRRESGGRQSSSRTIISLVAFVGLVIATPTWAKPKDAISPQVLAAKTVYIENQTQDKDLVATATNEIKHWGRFTIIPTRDEADLSIVFTHKLGIDKWGNTSFIVMDVYVAGKSEPAFEAKNAVYLISAPQHRTKQCIADFKKRLEPKH